METPRSYASTEPIETSQSSSRADKVIGTIWDAQRAHKGIIMMGSECEDCDANATLYVVNPEGSDDKELTRYPVPGRIFHYETNELLARSSAYFGKCLGDDKEVLLSMGESHDEEGKIHQYALTVEVDGRETRRLELEKHPKRSQIKARIAKGLCKEISGYDQPSEP